MADKKNTDMTAIPFGQGATVAIKGDKMIVEIDISEKAREAAPMSQSGKNKLVANSGGWQGVGSTDMKLNIGLMFKPKA